MKLTFILANTLNAKGTNNGDCKRSLCECDKQFSYQVAGAWNEWRDQARDELFYWLLRNVHSLQFRTDSC